MRKTPRQSFTIASHYAADGRAPFRDLHAAFSALEKAGWISEVVTVSKHRRGGKDLALPILSYCTPQQGPAVWIIGGIHGEEPAGPNAIAAGIPHIEELGRDMPVVLLPVCNPLGYAFNWRYLNMPQWQEGGMEQSVGDSEHMLPDPKNPGAARRSAALSPESEALTRHALELAKCYPLMLSINLHEDNRIDKGYIYSQGGAKDPVAQKIVELISSAGIAIQKSGKTRFGEKITHGIVGRESDGSIDELLSAEKVIVDGKTMPGPAAKTAIVIETPAGALPLARRREAHLAILKNLKTLAKMAAP
jgi:hypothetical protein